MRQELESPPGAMAKSLRSVDDEVDGQNSA